MRSTAAFMMALLLLLSPSAQEARGAPARCWRAPAVPCGPVLRGGDGASSCDSDLEALLDAASSGSSDARAGQQGMRGTRQARPPRPAVQPPPVPPVAAHQTVPHVAAAPREPQPCARGAAEREPRAPGGLGRPSEEHSSSSELPPSTSADRASESEVADTADTADTVDTADTADTADGAEFVIEDVQQLEAAVVERRRMLYGVQRPLENEPQHARAGTSEQHTHRAHARDQTLAEHGSREGCTRVPEQALGAHAELCAPDHAQRGEDAGEKQGQTPTDPASLEVMVFPGLWVSEGIAPAKICTLFVIVWLWSGYTCLT
jgi:hypothetical protein